MMSGSEGFVEAVRRNFLPLERECALRVAGFEEDEVDFRTTVSLSNETTGVDVVADRKEGGIFVIVYRLGPAPPQAGIDAFCIDDLLAVRAPSVRVQYTVKKKWKLDRVLQQYVELLRTHANDVLRGDFRMWPAVAREAWERVARHRNG